MRRTKKLYAELFDDPSLLFGGGTDTLLFPNGEPGTIWIRGPHHTGLEIRANAGPHGLACTVKTFIFRPPVTVAVYDKEHQRETLTHNGQEVGVVQYYPDEASQAYRDAYFSGEAGALGKHHAKYGDGAAVGPTPFSHRDGTCYKKGGE